MGFKEEKALQMQPSSKEPSEGLSENYQRFLVEQCHAHFEPRDGTYRSKSGYRYCSCDMCGATSTMNIGGRELCDFHYGHTSSKIEEDFWTQRMHDLRPLVAIALQFKTYIQPDVEKDQRLLRLFDELLEKKKRPAASGA